mgnify:FL=1
MEYSHFPVMLDETVSALDIKPDGIYVDCTLGGAGHTKEILSRLSQNGRVIGIDRDASALENAKNTVKDERLITVHDNFCNIAYILSSLGYEAVDGIIADLGVSSHQLDTASRGFSYMQDAPLDMRMDTSAALTAYDVVNNYSERELARILDIYGEERFASRIASRILAAREAEPIKTTLGLASVIESAIPAKFRHEGGHPAKRSFQAIRIEVNGELDCIPKLIDEGIPKLRSGGRMAVITFHSLEDRLVKNAFRTLENPCTCPKDIPVCVCGKKPVVRVITRKPILPGARELEINTRSHSAKLRVCEKL